MQELQRIMPSSLEYNFWHIFCYVMIDFLLAVDLFTIHSRFDQRAISKGGIKMRQITIYLSGSATMISPGARRYFHGG